MKPCPMQISKYLDRFECSCMVSIVRFGHRTKISIWRPWFYIIFPTERQPIFGELRSLQHRVKCQRRLQSGIGRAHQYVHTRRCSRGETLSQESSTRMLLLSCLGVD